MERAKNIKIGHIYQTNISNRKFFIYEETKKQYIGVHLKGGKRKKIGKDWPSAAYYFVK